MTTDTRPPAPGTVAVNGAPKPGQSFGWRQWEQITRIAAQKARDDAAAKRGQCLRLEQEIAELEATARRLERAIGVAGDTAPAVRLPGAGAARRHGGRADRPPQRRPRVAQGGGGRLRPGTGGQVMASETGAAAGATVTPAAAEPGLRAFTPGELRAWRRWAPYLREAGRMRRVLDEIRAEAQAGGQTR